MRFVWAVVAFVAAAVLIGAGIAQRTVFLGDKTAQATISDTAQLPYTLIDGAVLTSMPGAQTLMAHGEGTVFAAYGRTADLTAWLSDAAYNHVTMNGAEVVTEQMTPVPVAEDETATESEEDAAPRTPAGSDLWLDEFQQEGTLIAPLHLPDTMSVLIASDGVAPAPTDITVSWPLDNSTPWAGPLMLGGGILILTGVLLWLLGVRHVRRSRGPRRKGLPPLPVTEPIDLAVEAADKGVITAGSPASRRELSAGRRAFAVVPAVAISALLFTGCSADAWPQFDGSATPTPSASPSVIVPEGQQPPAVTETQAERILGRIAQTVADADEERDADLAGTRLAGAVLAERKTNYTLRGKVKDYKALATIPAKPMTILLPQAYEGWPRTVMSIVTDREDETVAPTIMVMTQEDAWSDYKLTYIANLEASAEFPGVAPATIGATKVQPDSAFLVIPPGELASAYADVLNNGEESDFAALFDLENDQFRASVAADRKDRLDDFNKTGKSTGSLTFSSTAGDHEPLALATLENGAIVAVDIHESDTVKPTNKDAVIKLPDNPTVKALAGAEQSATGFTTTFSDQLFFYVPAQGSTEKVRLLGYASNILNAKVIKK